MKLGRPLPALQLDAEQRQQLEALASSRSLPHGLVTHVRIILLSADGWSNKDIAVRLQLNPMTVGLWRRRFVKQGLTGLHEELRPGRPRSIPDEKVATLIRRTLRSKPKDGTHWSCRSLAAETRLSKSTVQRIWRAFGLQPHRARHFQLSNDPFFVEKVRTPPLSHALHADLLFLAQPSGNLVQHHHAEGHPSGNLPQRQRTCGQNRTLRAPLQR